MLGFGPFSEQPISDISLPPITGVIYVVDENDTANLVGAVAVTGTISATDQNDTATLNGEVAVSGTISVTDQNDTASLTGEVAVSGVISTTDQNDTATINGTVAVGGVIDVTDQNDTALIDGIAGGGDTHDGFTQDEIKRLKRIQKQIAVAEAQKIQARLDKRNKRKQSIRDLVDPKPTQVKETKVESETAVKIDKPSIDTKRLDAVIARLERQRDQLLLQAQTRNQLVRLQTQLAIMEAQAKAQEQDDEEALLMLL